MSGEMTNKDNKYMTKEAFDALKGILAVCVLIHHLYQFTGFLSDTSFGYAFLLLGHFAVVLFIFISGYGLGISYINKSDSYIKSFPKKRILPFYLTYLFFLLVYIIFELALKNEIKPSALILSFFYGSTIISFGWYLQLILLLYVAFFIIWRFVKKNAYKLIALSLFLFVFTVINFIIKSPANVYSPVFSFAIGVFVAYLKDKVDSFMKKQGILISIVSLFVFACLTVFATLIEFRYKDFVNANIILSVLYFVLNLFVDLFLIIFVISFLYIICSISYRLLINPVTRFIGLISLEIYALQGLFLRGFDPYFVKTLNNRYLYTLVSVVSISVCAFIINRALSLLKKKLLK